MGLIEPDSRVPAPPDRPPGDSATRALAPASRRAVLAIAASTFLEAVRDKVLYLLLFFGLFIFAASRLLSPLALGQGRRVTIDVGFAALSAFGCLATIFVGHQLIFREVERKTLYFLFARPLRKGEFVLGKYLGLLAVLTASVVVMGLLLAGVLLVSRYPFGAAFAEALMLCWLEFVILAAIAVLFAAVTSPVIAGLLTLAAWVMGHGSGELTALLKGGATPSMRFLIEAASWLVPRLDLYGDTMPLLDGGHYAPAEMLYGLLHALTYSAACLVVASWALSRREPAL
jgi:ABC-type transport system involved in multi-copper enzyme maturation permease subunit